jgi:hypothetical protein
MPLVEQFVDVHVTVEAPLPQLPEPVHVQRVVLLRTHNPEFTAVSVPPLVLSNLTCVMPEVLASFEQHLS